MGVIMYEMFSGVTPFAGDTLQAVMTGHLFKEPPRLANMPRDLGVPPPIAQIIDRMLVKEADARYASAEDVLSDLRDVNTQRQPAKAQTLDRVSPARKPDTAPAAPASAPRSGKGLIAAVAGIGVLAAAGVVAWQVLKKEPAPPVVAQPAVVAQPVTPAPPQPEPPATPVLDYDAVR
jgi:serine/threonine-protein kinase